MEKLEHFAGLLVDLEIANEVLPILLENGFDDWEQTIEILQHPELLDQIGIEDQQIKKQILSALVVAEEYEVSKQEQEERKKQEQELMKRQIEEEKRNYEEEKLQEQISQMDKQYQQLVLSTKKKPISVNDLLKGTSNKRPSNIDNRYIYDQDKEDLKFLNQLNVLSLNDKKFTSMEVLDKCKNVKALHLFGNCLFEIDQSLLHLKKLTTIHLENNYITKMQNFDNCVNLEKLYLNNNYISKLEGLQNCVYINELQISNQKSKKEFEFCETTLQALGANLQILDIENSNVKHIPESFIHLQSLGILKLRNNQMNNYEEFIEPFKNMPYLQELYVKNNPLSKNPKYRDKFVLIAKTLQSLDGKRILPKEREFLFALWKKKNGLLDEQKSGTQKKKNFQMEQINGQQIKLMDTQEDEYKDPKRYQKLNSGVDFRGNTTQQSSKHVPNRKYYG